MLAARAAHLEKIGKVVGEQNRHLHVDRAIAVVAQAEPLINRVAPQKDRAQNMQRVLLQDNALIGEDVRVGEIDDEGGVVVAQV